MIVTESLEPGLYHEQLVFEHGIRESGSGTWVDNEQRGCCISRRDRCVDSCGKWHLLLACGVSSVEVMMVSRGPSLHTSN